jgi:hypothetical protein
MALLNYENLSYPYQNHTCIRIQKLKRSQTLTICEMSCILYGVAAGLGRLNQGICAGVYLYALKTAFAG